MGESFASWFETSDAGPGATPVRGARTGGLYRESIESRVVSHRGRRGSSNRACTRRAIGRESVRGPRCIQWVSARPELRHAPFRPAPRTACRGARRARRGLVHACRQGRRRRAGHGRGAARRSLHAGRLERLRRTGPRAGRPRVGDDRGLAASLRAHPGALGGRAAVDRRGRGSSVVELPRARHAPAAADHRAFPQPRVAGRRRRGQGRRRLDRDAAARHRGVGRDLGEGRLRCGRSRCAFPVPAR